jgi:regulator of replication initiation timing
MSSLQIFSPEQRIQQLESNLISVLAQVQELDRQLRSSLAERADLQQRLDRLEALTGMAEDLIFENNAELQERLDVHDVRLDDLDGGPAEQQNDDSD